MDVYIVINVYSCENYIYLKCKSNSDNKCCIIILKYHINNIKNFLKTSRKDIKDCSLMEPL